jgi:hypothetical protein
MLEMTPDRIIKLNGPEGFYDFEWTEDLAANSWSVFASGNNDGNGASVPAPAFGTAVFFRAVNR